MDPATSGAATLAGHSTLLAEHQQMMKDMAETLRSVAAEVSQVGCIVQDLARRANIPPAPAPLVPDPALPVRESPVPSPDPYDGTLGRCRGFLFQCRQVFDRQLRTFASDRSKVSYVVGLLRGRALDWATNTLSIDRPNLVDYVTFVEDLRRVFDHPVDSEDAAQRLLRLRQGQASVAEHSVDFRILAAESGWGETALRGVFLHGLSEAVKDELATCNKSVSLEELIQLAIGLDNRMRERRRERNYKSQGVSPGMSSPSFRPRAPASAYQGERIGSQSPRPLPSSTSEVEPMQLGRTRLSSRERERRFGAGECMYCGQLGHSVSSCPVRPNGGAHQ